MKKFFFFKSSKSSGAEKENISENGLNNHVKKSSRSPKALFGESRKQHIDRRSYVSNPGFQRSRSLSMAALPESGLDWMDFSCPSEQSRSSFSVSSQDLKKSSNTFRKPKTELEVFGTGDMPERRRASTSHASLQEFLGSSFSSSNVSSSVLDRYIDGEQKERKSFGNDYSQRTHVEQRKENSKRPPRAQLPSVAAPAGNFTDNPISQSFRDVDGTQQRIATKDRTENRYASESPRKIAKNVIERLSQCGSPRKASSKDDTNSSSPLTSEDLYVDSLSRPSSLTNKSSPSLDEDVANSRIGSNSVADEDEIDAKLHNALKEGNERAMFLSEEFEQQRFIRDSAFDVPSLLQKIKTLAEEKMHLAFEVSKILRTHITDRANTNGELKQVKTELYNETRRLEGEKNEMQLSLEKELDRRSREWSLKLEKFQSEEHRLRERVRDLAEQNVAMQREISSLKEREMENRNIKMHSDQQLNDQTMSLNEFTKQNQDLLDNMLHLKEQLKAATEDRDCFQRNFVEKETECKDLQKSVARLQRTYNEQEKTIGELRESLLEKVGSNMFHESVNSHTKRLQKEQIRLAGVEQSLRKEAESYKLEVFTLRHENIELLSRLKGVEKEGSLFTLKLDQEMWSRIQCLQNQGLPLLNESAQMCSKLLAVIKERNHSIRDNQQVVKAIRNSLDGQFLMEADVKIQGFKRGIESLTRSLQTLSVSLEQKRNRAALHLQSSCTEQEQQHGIKPTFEVTLKWELKDEILLTNLLREKLHCKELELEQVQAELATCVRGNEILKCEVQNALDCFSSANHKMKELEIQNIKKDQCINQIQDDLKESTKELTRIKSVLQNVSNERDVIWDELKQRSENNMLLNSEVNALKKKNDSLEEDLLLKEGQISILRDSIGRRSFD